MCFNDDKAGGAYRAARELGLQVGQDLSVVGFDNITQAETIWPPLSSADIHSKKIGSIATTKVSQMLSEGRVDAPSEVMTPELVERASVARIA